MAGDDGSLYDVAQVTHAKDAWTKGWTGKGVDVALVDSGVAPVQGLTSGNVVQGPDLSFESQDPALVHRDTFGHGTHMASIIAGRDAAGTGATYARTDTHQFTGRGPRRPPGVGQGGGGGRRQRREPGHRGRSTG